MCSEAPAPPPRRRKRMVEADISATPEVVAAVRNPVFRRPGRRRHAGTAEPPIYIATPEAVAGCLATYSSCSTTATLAPKRVPLQATESHSVACPTPLLRS
ncbi:MAG: hypothetical protein PUB55_04025 [Bacteroidales bacterium]|nr:hypothetical protein [Bacteroidales bacterium]